MLAHRWWTQLGQDSSSAASGKCVLHMLVVWHHQQAHGVAGNASKCNSRLHTIQFLVSWHAHSHLQ